MGSIIPDRTKPTRILITAHVKNSDILGSGTGPLVTTWGIIPVDVSRLAIMVIVSSLTGGCSPSKWPKWLINGRY